MTWGSYGKFKSDMKENIVSFIGLFCKKDLDSMIHDSFISDLTVPYDMGWLQLVGSLKL